MARTVGDFLVERLQQWGVRRVFGYPGDGINGVIAALAKADDRLEFIQARHEEMAAFMATGHAKFTGEVGVCLATSGPGAIHLLNGLYDALLDHQPVVAIVGQQRRAALGGHYQQEVDLHALFKDVAHEFVQTVTTPAQMRHVIDSAMRTAAAERSPTCVILPNDIQTMEAQDPPREHGTVHSGVGYANPHPVPSQDALEHAAAVLNAGERVAMLVGAGALHATEELILVADRLQAGAAKALLGKAALPDQLPWVTGAIGLLGTRPSWELMNDCDTLLMVGSGFPYSEFLPKEGRARGVQIDIDPRMISLRYPMEVNLVGDSADTLRLLLPLLEQKQPGKWRGRIEKNVRAWWETLEERAAVEAKPINPQRVFRELSARLPDGCIIAGDSGSGTDWYARDVMLRPGMKASLSGGLATMGSAVPYAIAAKFAHPDRVVIALAGDGAMQMNGMSELITIAKYWRRWADPRLVVMVLNNGDLNQVTWEQRAMEGFPKFSASQDLPIIPFASFAELIGLRGIAVDAPDAVGPAWDSAFACDRPCVLDMRTDPNVPPLLPHIPLKFARAYAEALLKGDPDAIDVVKATLKQVFA